MTDPKAMLDGAIDGEDWSSAAFALLALPVSASFSKLIVERLASIGFRHVEVRPADKRLIARLADIGRAA